MTGGATSPLTVVPFADLLDALRRQGFAVGVDHYVRIYALLDRVGDECSPQQLKTLLCPLLATSRAEQEQFYRTFDQLFGLFEERATGSPSVSDDALPLTNVPATPTATAPAVEMPEGNDTAYPKVGWVVAAGSTVGSLRRRLASRPRWRLFLAASVLCAGFLGIVVWMARTPRVPSTASGPPVVSGPATLPSVDNSSMPVAPPPAARSAPQTVRSPSAPAPAPAPSRAEEPRARSPLWWLLLALGFTVGGGAFWRWTRRDVGNLGLVRERSVRPPYTWPVRVPPARHPYNHTADIAEAARVIRTREAGESQRLAVDASIAATIAARGQPALRFRSDTRPPDYLILVERTSNGDHGAPLFNALVDSLAREDVHLTRFYFDRDPRVCFAESETEPTLLTTLRDRFPTHRLLIFATGDQLIDPVSMQLHSWVERVMDWRDRIVFTPEPVSSWALREQALAKWFLVAPASVDGVRAAGEWLASADRTEQPRVADDVDATIAPSGSGTDAVEALRRYLPGGAFEWLCGCAIYPELRWDLTLFIGSLPCMRADVVTEANLLRLIRLRWFREGAMPDDLRLALIGALPLDTAKAVRAALVVLLEQHPPPADSVAAPQHQLHLAMQRLLSSTETPKDGRGLTRAFEGVPERELLQERVYLRLLRQDGNRALATYLPKRLQKTLQPATTGTRAGGRVLQASVAAAGLLLALGVLSSWLGNRALATRVNAAVQAVAAVPVMTNVPGKVVFPSVEALRRLDALRATLDTVGGYVSNGPPLRLRFGLWRGPALLEASRPVWAEGFRHMLLDPALGTIIDSLRALPDAPTSNSEYGTTYGRLKAYLITTSAPDNSTAEFLAPVLLASWQRGQRTDEEITTLARWQFEYYAGELPRYNPFPMAADNSIVVRARRFLAGFTDIEQIYLNMVAAANKGAPPVRIPQAPGVLTATSEVAGAYSTAGHAFMKRGFANIDEYTKRETWVVGTAQSTRAASKDTVAAALRGRYRGDYIRTWTQVVQSALLAKPASLNDASTKLEQLSGVTSPILQVMRTVATNTDVDSVVRAAFQPVHAVTPPAVIDKFVSEKNVSYISALLRLSTALSRVPDRPLPTDSQAIKSYRLRLMLTLSHALGARDVEQELVSTFLLTATSSPVASAVDRLLQAPIAAAEALLRDAMTLKGQAPPSFVTMGGAAARTMLDSISKALDPSDADANAARAAIPALRAVLARLPTPGDSTWAYIRIAEAHLLLDEVRDACTALTMARGNAKSMNQLAVINNYVRMLKCVP